jgi:serine/threonine protein phosphatase 1
MPPRTIAVGDIHGCSLALAGLLAALDPRQEDTIITLGDYINRGLDSKGVLDQLIALESRCRLIPLLGNHEEMLLGAREGGDDFEFFMACGGIATLDSYGSTGQLDLIPRDHWSFLKRCRDYFETDRHIFLHANYKPDVSFDRLDSHTLRWLSLRDFVPDRPHCSGKVAILGHTPQSEVLNLGYLKCIDTGCCTGGWLTALEVGTDQVWQVDERGEVRVSLEPVRG